MVVSCFSDHTCSNFRYVFAEMQLGRSPTTWRWSAPKSRRRGLLRMLRNHGRKKLISFLIKFVTKYNLNYLGGGRIFPGTFKPQLWETRLLLETGKHIHRKFLSSPFFQNEREENREEIATVFTVGRYHGLRFLN